MATASGDERPSQRSLEGLKKEAKRWLKALHAGDATARARLERTLGAVSPEPSLRDVQLALAREHGFDGWASLKIALASGAPVDRHRGERADWLLEAACIDPIITNGPSAQASHLAAAMRILKRHPDVARANIHTAAVCGELAEVERILRERPEAANERGGPVRWRMIKARESQWTPLLHLAYGRLPIPAASENAVAIAAALLESGADPNAYFEAGSHPNRYTVLTGIVGGGEESTPPHPQAEVLMRLLLERGAKSFDVQANYNTMLSPEPFRWLDLLYSYSLKQGTERDWDAPMGRNGWSSLEWFLPVALERGDTERIEWLLARGAKREKVERSRGTATPSRPTDEQRFVDAALALDRDTVTGLLQEHAEYLRSPTAMFTAAEHDRDDVVRFLLDVGVPIDVEDQSKQQPLHVAASHDAFRVATLLIERGADQSATETNWNNTPIDHAIYGNKTRMIELLSRDSRDVFRVTWVGNVDRLRALLDEDPSLARKQNDGETPLMWLPDDESKAMDAAKLLLDHGADASVRAASGKTAADLASKRGLDDVANLLRAAEQAPP